jgi:benzil reductase ((S)-benzoin forming)
MKLAIISGGSQGLGAALCDRYARAGFQLLEFSRHAPHSFSIGCDFSQPQALSVCLSKAFAPYREATLDELVVISNAATLDPIAPNGALDSESIQRNLNINLVGAIIFMNAALRAFGGHAARKTLVSISSGAAHKGYAGWSLYCASKAGLENYLRAVAAEQQREAQPFATLSIDPGVMDSGMQALIRQTSTEQFPARERFIGLHQSGQLRPPGDIAAAIVELVARNHAPASCLKAAEALPGPPG